MCLLLAIMDHPNYHRYRAAFLDTSDDWQYVSSSDEGADEDGDDGLLTPVSMTHHSDLDPSHASSALLNSSWIGGDRKDCAANFR